MGQDEQGVFVQGRVDKIEGHFSFGVSWPKKLWQT
jgi:hypothetical protein